MGTSSSYKGSSSSSWNKARKLFVETETGEPAQDDNENSEQQSLPLASALAEALISDNPTAVNSTINFRTSGIIGGGSGGGSIRESRNSGNGRSGTVRHVAKGAARGATAIRVAYGIRNGETSVLDQVGLSLDELSSLSPRQQCQRIAKEILGDANHPDDYALNRATMEHLKNILLSEEMPSIEDTIRDFVAEWIFQISLVELRAETNEQEMSDVQIKNMETRLHSWLKIKTKQLNFPDSRNLTVQQFSNSTAKLTASALKMISKMK